MSKTYTIRRVELKDRPCGIKDKSVSCRFNPEGKGLGCYRETCKCDEELFLHRCMGCQHSDNDNWCTLKQCIFPYHIEKYREVLDKNIILIGFTKQLTGNQKEMFQGLKHLIEVQNQLLQAQGNMAICITNLSNLLINSNGHSNKEQNN